MYGSTVLQTVATAWSDPSMLRQLLPPKQQTRFDYWVNYFASEQLDLFRQEDV